MVEARLEDFYNLSTLSNFEQKLQKLADSPRFAPIKSLSVSSPSHMSQSTEVEEYKIDSPLREPATQDSYYECLISSQPLIQYRKYHVFVQ